ncbi:MAG: acyltransferase family protein [Clostridiales bacterium]|nr:acyltransferase family protein [Clostridiales bacterium]
MNKTKRVEYIDLFRGFGILLMIMGHVGFGSRFDHFIHAFHMPMFFFVSGLFFRREDASVKDVAVRKARSLLLPYVVFGAFHEVVYSVMQGGIATSELRHLLWENTSGLPIAGALWFLTALYFVDLVYYLLDRYINSMKMLSFIVALIALFGNTINLFCPFRLPWAMDAAFVGLGLYHIARLLINSPDKWEKKLFHLPLTSALLLGGATFLIFLNGYINMRTGTYAIIPLFWVNAVLATLTGLNLSRHMDDRIGRKGNALLRCVKTMGRNSITFLCLNQLVILLWKNFFAQMPPMNGFVKSLAILVLTVIVLMGLDCVIQRTKLRVVIGK